MKRLKLITLLITFGLIVPMIPSVAADLPDEQFNYFPFANSNQVAAYWSESTEIIPPMSGIIGTNPISESVEKTGICSSIFDRNCENFDRFFWAAFSDFCDDSKIQSNIEAVTEISFNCIDEIQAIDPFGNVTAVNGLKSQLIRKVNPQISFNYLGTGLTLPKGSQRSIVRIPGAIHKGGSDLYLVDMFMSGDFYRTKDGSGKCFTHSGKTACLNEGEENKFFAAIKPIVSTPTTYRPFDQQSLFDKNRIFLGFGGTSLECVLIEQGICWKATGFPDGYSFGVKMKISAGRLNGWLHGRALMNDFESSASEVARGTSKIPTQIISISGRPSKVAVAGGLKDDTDLKDMMKELNITTIRNFFYNSFWSNFSLDRFIGFSKLIGDTALASPQVWSIRNIRSRDLLNLDQNTQSCIKKEPGVSGYVSTNATAYSAGPPSFNSQQGTLDYRVASTHLNKDGSLNRGNYSLVIKNQVAQCIYQFNAAPVSASISIVSEAGTNVVATSTLQSNADWIKLKTDNFTFSAPTLRVKLEAEAVKEPTPIVSQKPTVSVKKISISCVKGKITKKVTGVSPKCPAGYKKK